MFGSTPDTFVSINVFLEDGIVHFFAIFAIV